MRERRGEPAGSAARALAATPVPSQGIEAALDAVARAPDREGAPGELFVAVVHSADSIRFVAAATSREALVRQLAAHVWRSGQDELWADDAARVRALLARGEAEAAVEHYFATVGERWDAEWLVTARVGRAAVEERAPVLARV